MKYIKEWSDSQKRRYIDWALLLAFLIGMFSTLWMPDRVESKFFLVIVLLVLGFDAWKNHAPTMRLFETHIPNHDKDREPMRLAWFTGLAGFSLFLVCLWTGAFRGDFWASMLDKSFSEWLMVKIPTVAGQQVMLQLLIVPVLLRLFQRVSVVVVVGALLFSLLHLPNLLLVGLTLVAGLFWIASYCRSQKLLPIVVSHAVLAIMAAGFCGEYVLNMRVGASCVALLPGQLESESGVRYEFPRCVIGCAERLSQSGDQLVIEGWVYDCVHHRCPTALFIKVADRLVELKDTQFELVKSGQWSNARNGGFVGLECYSFTAKVSISRTEVPYLETSETELMTFGPAEFQLYAANINGRVAELGRMEELKAAPSRHEETVVLFPVEVDGRVDRLEWQNGRLNLRGWAADLKASCLVKQICIESDGELTFIDLANHRLERPTTAKAIDQPALLECGFAVSVGPLAIVDLSELRCYAVDEQQQCHRLQFTERAEAWIANRLEKEGQVLR